MTLARTILCALALLSASSRVADAQWSLAAPVIGETRVYLAAGVEQAAIATLGASRVVPALRRPLLVRLDASVAVGAADAADHRVRLGGELPLVSRGAARVTVGLAAVQRATSNTIFHALSVGADVQATAGVHARFGFVALESGIEQAVVTRFRFTERYRANYPLARDGWYATTAATARAGVALGLTTGRYELHARTGLVRAPGGESLIPPAYLTLGAGRRFR